MLVRPLSPELSAKAEGNLNETPKRLQDGIYQLKVWISKQPHLRARTDDQWLTAFLRGCKHSIERAKAKLDLYYSLRTISPDLFAFKYQDQRFNILLQTQTVLVLPGRINPGDPTVVLVRPRLYDPAMFGILEYFSFMHKFQQVLFMEDDAFMINGVMGVVDLEGVTLAHILQMTPIQIRKIVTAGQDASPLRVKSLHFMNTVAALEAVINLTTKFLNKKHKERIHMYSKDMSELYEKYIDKRILPIECGGSWGSSQDIVDYWQRKFDEYAPWFEEELKWGTDEFKRPGKPRTADEIFGVEGSFRKLDVD